MLTFATFANEQETWSITAEAVGNLICFTGIWLQALNKQVYDSIVHLEKKCLWILCVVCLCVCVHVCVSECVCVGLDCSKAQWVTIRFVGGPAWCFSCCISADLLKLFSTIWLREDFASRSARWTCAHSHAHTHTHTYTESFTFCGHGTESRGGFIWAVVSRNLLFPYGSNTPDDCHKH